jgi:cyclin H
VTAAYLACKVEEFNVSLEQFVSNINGNKERAMEIILNHELLVSINIGNSN